LQKVRAPAHSLFARNAYLGTIGTQDRQISGGIDHAPGSAMTQINSFRDLLVWKKAMDLAVRCYGASRRMPKDEHGVLGYQIRKCAVSMPSNIAEGKARQSTAIYMNHLWVAHGSDAELETQLELGARVKVVSEQEAAALISDAQEIGRMIQGLVKSLERSIERPRG
jgi:four helix bundle protein